MTSDMRRSKSLLDSLTHHFGSSPVAGPLATFVVVLLLCLLFVPNFGSWRTISGIVTAVSISGFVTIGITFLMVAGEFDLSIGAMIAMSGYLFGAVAVGADSQITRGLAAVGLPVAEGSGNFVLALLLALAVPALMGLVNGLILIWTRIPSFIVTLGTRQIYRGLVWLTSGGVLLQTLERPPIFNMFNGRFELLNNLPVLDGANFRTATVWLLVAAFLGQYLLVHTRFGNHVFAIGGNVGAATAQGIRTARTKVLCFVFSGFMAGAAGVISFSQFRSVRVAEQAGVELTAIAASVVGGALLSGGYGSVWGAVVGILMISLLRSAVILLDIPFIPADNFPAVIGATIIASVILNNYLRTRASA